MVKIFSVCTHRTIERQNEILEFCQSNKNFLEHILDTGSESFEWGSKQHRDFTAHGTLKLRDESRKDVAAVNVADMIRRKSAGSDRAYQAESLSKRQNNLEELPSSISQSKNSPFAKSVALIKDLENLQYKELDFPQDLTQIEKGWIALPRPDGKNATTIRQVDKGLLKDKDGNITGQLVRLKDGTVGVQDSKLAIKAIDAKTYLSFLGTGMQHAYLLAQNAQFADAGQTLSAIGSIIQSQQQTVKLGNLRNASMHFELANEGKGAKTIDSISLDEDGDGVKNGVVDLEQLKAKAELVLQYVELVHKEVNDTISKTDSLRLHPELTYAASRNAKEEARQRCEEYKAKLDRLQAAFKYGKLHPGDRKFLLEDPTKAVLPLVLQGKVNVPHSVAAQGLNSTESIAIARGAIYMTNPGLPFAGNSSEPLVLQMKDGLLYRQINCTVSGARQADTESEPQMTVDKLPCGRLLPGKSNVTCY